MKKSILALLSLMVIISTINAASAKTATTSPAMATAIRYYKSGNYTQSYLSCKEIVQKDPSNGLAYYYLGMSSTQLGKRAEALENYDKAIALSPKGILGQYAKRAKRCIELREKCHEPYNDEMSTEDIFIKNKSRFTEEARSTHEKEKIENLKREMNRNIEITPREFKDYKDFSSQAPTNEEIANAIQVLQKAGISSGNDLFSLIGNNNSSVSEYDILNSLFTNNKDVQNISPQVIKALLSNQMTSSF